MAAGEWNSTPWAARVVDRPRPEGSFQRHVREVRAAKLSPCSPLSGDEGEACACLERLMM